jgi:hypothetical protein
MHIAKKEKKKEIKILPKQTKTHNSKNTTCGDDTLTPKKVPPKTMVLGS